MGGCLRGCLVVIAILFLLPLLPFLLVGLVVFAVGRLLVGLWQSERPIRTKRAVTGLLFYPAGVYFLYRFTRFQPAVKHAFLAAAVVATVIMSNAPALALPLVTILGATFLAFFLVGSNELPARAATVTVTPAAPRPLSRPDVPTDDLRRLLEIEETPSGAERRLLLSREFNRLATEICGPAPLDRASWPDRQRLSVLQEEVDLLRASAADTPAALAAPDAGVLAGSALRSVIDDLQHYAELMMAIQSASRTDPRRLRLMARERGRIQSVQDELIERLQES